MKPTMKVMIPASLIINPTCLTKDQGEVSSQKVSRDPFSKAVMHIISKEYHKEIEVNETLRFLVEQCLREWESLLQIKQVIREKVESERIINEVARSLSNEIFQIRSYRRGCAIFFYGDRDELIHFIIKGTIQLFIPKTQSEMKAEAEFSKRLQGQYLQKKKGEDKEAYIQPLQKLNEKSKDNYSKDTNQDKSKNNENSFLSPQQPSYDAHDNQPQLGLVINAIQKLKGSHLELLRGNERVRRKYIEGSSQIEKIKKVSQAGPKQSFGELSMVMEKPRAFTAIASEESFIVSFTSKSYKKIIGDHFAYLNSKYIFLNSYFALSVRKETLFHLGVLFDKEISLNLGDPLYKEGELCNQVYLLKRGKIEFFRYIYDSTTKVTSKRQQNLSERQDAEAKEQLNLRQSKGEQAKEQNNKDGAKEVCLGMIQQGEFFGFEDLLVGSGKGYSHFSKSVSQNKRTYSARVISSDAVVFSIERAAFLRLLQSNSVLDQEIKSKAVMKIQYHSQRMEELKRFAEAQKRSFQAQRVQNGNQDAEMKKQQPSSQMQATTITMELPLFPSQHEKKGFKDKNLHNINRKLDSKNQLDDQKSLQQQIQDAKIIFQQQQQLLKEQQLQKEIQQKQQISNQQKKQDGTNQEHVDYLTKMQMKIQQELAAFDIPKDISKGNVQFLKFADNQFSDFKSMKQYYLELEEKYRQIKKSKHELNMSDENLIALERLFTQTNSSSIKQFKNTYSKKNMIPQSSPILNKISPRKPNNLKSNNNPVILEKEEEKSNASESKIIPPSTNHASYNNDSCQKGKQFNYFAKKTEQSFVQFQNEEQDKVDPLQQKLSLNQIGSDILFHSGSITSPSLCMIQPRSSAITSSDSLASTPRSSYSHGEKNKNSESNINEIGVNSEKENKVQFHFLPETHHQKLRKFSEILSPQKQDFNLFYFRESTQYKSCSHFKEGGSQSEFPQNLFQSHNDLNPQLSPSVQEHSFDFNQTTTQQELSQNIPNIKTQESSQLLHTTKSKNKKRKYMLSLPDVKQVMFDKQEKLNSQQKAISVYIPPQQQNASEEIIQFSSQMSPSRPSLETNFIKSSFTQSKVSYSQTTSPSSKSIYFNQYLARSESAKKLMTDFKQLISSRDIQSQQSHQRKLITQQSQRTSQSQLENSGTLIVNPACFSQSVTIKRKQQLSSTKIEFFNPKQTPQTSTDTTTKAAAAVKSKSSSQPVRLLSKSFKNPQAYFQQLYFNRKVE